MKIYIDWSIRKYKARYVVQKFKQYFDQDYLGTLANVIKSDCYEILMARAMTKDLKLE